MIQKFKDFLNESKLDLSSINKYTNEINIALKRLYNSNFWKNDVKTFKEFLSFFKHDIGFLKFLLTKKISDKKQKPIFSKWIPKACFYNSLSYVHKYDDVELAFGYLIYKPDFYTAIESINKEDSYQYRNLWILGKILHGFCVKNGSIIDPTIKSNNNCFYIYEIVPKELWYKWNWKDNDSNFDAGDFFDYVYDKIDENDNNSIKWYLSQNF